ncbi:hypothetical protein ACQB6R_07070 [Propionibacteriaceae bacterium G1746]
MQAIGSGFAVMLVGLALAAVGGQQLGLVLVAIVVVQSGLQVALVLTQTRMLSIDGSARSRLNTLYVVTNFLGGAVGSTLATFLWPRGGWPAVMAAGAVVVALALLAWFVQWTRQRAR